MISPLEVGFEPHPPHQITTNGVEDFKKLLRSKRIRKKCVRVHVSISSTLVYTHLLDLEEDDGFVVNLAGNLDEFTELLEKGFEHIGDYEEEKVLRKRK